MQFLRTLIWVLLAVILAAFAFNNWVSVPVRLWSGLVADINLPLLVGIAFALGFVPLYILHTTTRWRMKARLATAERTLADLRAATLAPAPALAADPPPVEATPETASASRDLTPPPAPPSLL